MIWQIGVIGSAQERDQKGAAVQRAFSTMGSVQAQRVPSPDPMPLLQLDDPNKTLTRPQIRALGAAQGVDICFASPPPPRCDLLVTDMEATVILDEMLDILAEERGLGPEISAITTRAMAGELDFAGSLAERSRLLAGTTEAQLAALLPRIRYTPGAKTLVQTMKAQGATTVLVTGGYGIFADEVARHCGFDAVVANHPEIIDGVMTGALILPIGDAATKRKALLDQCCALGISPEFACCIGDGANDILMLRESGLSVSYKGKPVVQECVDLDITEGDLTAVLVAQGYARSEFIT